MTPDEELQHTARAMIAAAEAGKSAVRVLQRLCPHIARQIGRDARYPGLLSLWGRSVNRDENVGQVIVHPAILHAIGTLAGVPMRGEVVHAGLQHTYGYLFSTIDTPYGAKRARWLSTDLERGFGLDLSLLSDRPRAGTLLANVTWFIGQVAFRERPHLLRRLEANAGAVAPALVARREGPSSCRIVEQAVLPGQAKRVIALITDLVAFPQPPAAGDNTLLIYSIQAGRRAPLRLITAFPVRPTTVQDLLASVPVRGQVALRPRYNAHVAGWHRPTLRGRRASSFFEPERG